MKNLTLSILALATVIGIVPLSAYPVDTTKDGITLSAYNSYKSEKLKNNNLDCITIKIKNDSDEPIVIANDITLSSFMANEKQIKDAMKITRQDILTPFFQWTLVQFLICSMVDIPDLVSLYRWDHNPHVNANVEDIPGEAVYVPIDLLRRKLVNDNVNHYLDLKSKIKKSFIGSILISPITGILMALIPCYENEVQIQKILQKNLIHKTTTIEKSKEFKFYACIDLEKYKRSISKNITIKLHKKDTEQVILFDINTTDVLQTQTA